MRRQLCPWDSALAVVAFLAFVRSAQAAAPSYDDGYGGGEAEAQDEGKPCFNDGYGAPCSNDDLVAGAALPDDGRILRIQAIGQEDYGSGSDYGSEDGLLPCTCLHTWTSYERVPAEGTSIGNGTCGENNQGCPETPCDGDANGPWCKVEHSPCLEEESTHLGGWAYCEPMCDSFTWEVVGGRQDEPPSFMGVDAQAFAEKYGGESCWDKTNPTEGFPHFCFDKCIESPFCTGLVVFNNLLESGYDKERKSHFRATPVTLLLTNTKNILQYSKTNGVWVNGTEADATDVKIDGLEQAWESTAVGGIESGHLPPTGTLTYFGLNRSKAACTSCDADDDCSSSEWSTWARSGRKPEGALLFTPDYCNSAGKCLRYGSRCDADEDVLKKNDCSDGSHCSSAGYCRVGAPDCDSFTWEVVGGTYPEPPSFMGGEEPVTWEESHGGTSCWEDGTEQEEGFPHSCFDKCIDDPSCTGLIVHNFPSGLSAPDPEWEPLTITVLLTNTENILDTHPGSRFETTGEPGSAGWKKGGLYSKVETDVVEQAFKFKAGGEWGNDETITYFGINRDKAECISCDVNDDCASTSLWARDKQKLNAAAADVGAKPGALLFAPSYCSGAGYCLRCDADAENEPGCQWGRGAGYGAYFYYSEIGGVRGYSGRSLR